MAAVLATAIATPEEWYHGYVVNDTPVPEGSKQTTLSPTSKAEAIRLLQRLHRNLGHPTPKALCELLQSRGANQVILDCAASYQCTACRYRKPNQVAPSKMVESSTFNQLVQADVMWIKNCSKKYPSLSVIDTATKYQERFSMERRLIT